MRVPRSFRGVVHPVETFREWRLSLATALLLVLALGVLNGVGAWAAADAAAATVDGTVQVPNPDRPSQETCERYADMQSPSPVFRSTLEECREKPRYVDRSLHAAAADAAGDAALSAFLATVAGAFVALAVVVTATNGRVGAGHALGLASVVLVPAALRYVARPLLVSLSAGGWDPGAETLEGVRTATLQFASGASLTLFVAVALATLAWQAAVLAGALRGLIDTTWLFATGVGVVSVAPPVVVLVGLSQPLFHAVFFLGLLAMLVGLAFVGVPEVIIAVNTSLELIGMRGRDGVSPRGWYVWLHRAGGTLLVAAGAVVVGWPLFG